MSKFVYIGGINDKYIYYSEDRDEFYAVDENFFAFEAERDFEVPSDFFTPEQLEKLASVRVTDEHQLKSLMFMYKLLKKYQKIEIFYKVKDKIREKKESISPEMRKDMSMYFATSCIFTIIAIIVYLNTEPLRERLADTYKETVDKYHYEHQNDEENLNSFYDAIEANSTISEEVKSALKADFKVLVESDIYISHNIIPKKYGVKGICTRITSTDFTNYDESNYIEILAYILLHNKDTVAISLARQLDECANNREPSLESLIFGSIYTDDKTKLLTDIFNYGTDKYIDDLAEYYNVDKKKIKELIDLIDEYSKAESSEEKESAKNSFYDKLAIIFSNYYRDNKNVKEIDKYILASQVYNGEFKYSNNLFNNTFTITYNDPTYGTYNLYFDTQTNTDISQAVYFEKLVELIKEKGNNLDYNDPDCRFLLYLTTLACEDDLYYHYDEVTNCITPEELALVIYDRVFSVNTGFANLKPQVLYAYFSNGTICVEDIYREFNIPDDNAFSLALFVEYDKCLRKDIEEGNLSEEDYQKRLETILKWVSKDGEEIYNILTDALNTNSALFSELKLYPFTYSYANEDIKEYMYVPKE